MALSMTGIASYVLYPALALAGGAGLALIRPPAVTARSAIQHFTAGVVFAALATELLPELMHRRMPWVTLTGFALGVLAMLGIKHLAEKFGQKGIANARNSASLLWVLGVDITLDGVLIGLGFAAGQKQGLLLTVALSLEVLFLGLSATSALIGAGATRARITVMTALLTAFLISGALVGGLILVNASPLMLDAILAFGVAALLYLVTEELLVEAHETPETALQTATFFIGFVGLLILEMTI